VLRIAIGFVTDVVQVCCGDGLETAAICEGEVTREERVDVVVEDGGNMKETAAVADDEEDADCDVVIVFIKSPLSSTLIADEEGSSFTRFRFILQLEYRNRCVAVVFF
jgi:hypothetical protein